MNDRQLKMEGNMNASEFKSTMSSLNHGVVMEAAARNLQKEMLRDQAASGAGGERVAFDMNEMGQDEELEQLQRDRIAQMKASKAFERLRC